MAACLTILAAAGLLSCTDTPVQPQNEVALATVPGTDSVALTYICGNMFRIRNSSFESRSVRWDIYNAAPADTGSLRARGRDVGSAYVDYFVTSRTKGTMRLFVGSTLVATKANGNLPMCAAPVDSTAFTNTGRPSIKYLAREPRLALDDSTVVLRTVVTVKFKANATSSERRAFQRLFGAQLIGVYPSDDDDPATQYDFRVPDPGSNLAAYQTLTNQMRAHAAVLSIDEREALSPVHLDGSRYPNDDIGFTRSDYISAAPTTWAARALRLPQAWSCETGRYSSSPVRIAVVEQNFPAAFSSDLGNSLSAPIFRAINWKIGVLPAPTNSDSVYYALHGHWVSGFVSAEGDNTIGVAAPLWRSDLRIFSMENTDHQRGAGTVTFAVEVTPAIVAAKPRILSISSDFGPFSKASTLRSNVQDMVQVLSETMTLLPNLLIVKSAGNDTINGNYRTASFRKRTAFLSALLKLRDSASSFRDRIVFVGASTQNGNRWIASNTLSGSLDLYAPGAEVFSVEPGGISTSPLYGTSFSAPLVAGIAGQLLTMDSTLTAAEVKQLLLDGARDSVENANGDNILPSPVGNTTDVVHEADAFGSLRLLSQRVGRPLCGALVSVARDSASTTGIDSARFDVIIRRYGSAAVERLKFDRDSKRLIYPDQFGPQLSVAPGGRTISVTSGAQGFQTRVNVFQLSASQWTATSLIPDLFGLLYGERDTLRVESDGVIFATASAGRLPKVLFQNIAAEPIWGSSYSFAPDGSAFAYGTEGSGATFASKLWTVFRNGASSSLVLDPDNSLDFKSTAWSPDSRTVFAAYVKGVPVSSTSSNFQSVFVRASTAGQSLSETARNAFVIAAGTVRVGSTLATSDEGGRLLFRDGSNYASVDCTIRSLRASALDISRTLLQRKPEPCATLPPQGPGGGGGQEGRIAKRTPRLTAASVRRSALSSQF